ncbi:TRAP transporter small permease [Aquisalibacillus elongatus]|uniref:TRAP-type C4-dicarboxylate transport system permease small subunit n=1 Tax=Aquisalibacillus elongatus TaxID=485577 RepID=A0A3N5BFI4_9BACI|nr:TRAP transporter small permease [Aquisalibacillus elongatus]RPF54040.1 TRAP-type C4-dicarboxylate transport system permease small subunit [Aquisalibacillus elongatus]
MKNNGEKPFGKMLNKVDQAFLKIEEFILSSAVILIALMVCGNVISRELTGTSLLFHQEVAFFAIIVSTFMGISYAARKGRHISMSAIYDTVPWKMRKTMAIFIPLITSVSLFVLAYYSYFYVYDIFEIGTTSTNLQIPMYVMYAFVPLGFIMGGIQYLRNLIVNITNKEVYIGTDALDYNDVKPEDREVDDQMQL